MLAKHDLKAKLRIALRQMEDDPKRILIEDALVSRDSGQVSVRITLRPITIPQLSEPLTLITFEDLPQVLPVTQQARAPQAITDSALLQQLENELHITREDLQSSIEELESANEELQAANEEVMSVNEELQSSNEEL